MDTFDLEKYNSAQEQLQDEQSEVSNCSCGD